MMRFLSLLTLLVLVAGCDTNNFEPHVSEIVVESYLVANEPMPKVRVSRSTSSRQLYDFTQNALRNADVTVSRLGQNGEVEEVTRFEMFDEQPGVYWPTEANVVRPGSEYRLEINTTNFGNATASTIIPGAFELLETNADTLLYQGNEQFELTVTRSSFPGRQNIFVFSTESLTPTRELLTPFYREFEGDSDDDIARLRITESPLINEGNYDINSDGTLTIKLPWIAVAFFGDNRLTANAVDDNLYDFIRTQTVQQGGSTLSPGEIPNVIDHIEGGNGVFGSFARSSLEVFIIPSEF